MKRVLIIVTLFLFVQIINAQDIPVLPLPAHIEEGKAPVSFQSAGLLYSGTDTGTTKKLQWHWDKFNKEFPQKEPKKIQLILLGKNKKNDALLSGFDSVWKDKIGAEGYVLFFTAKQRIIAANTEAGLFYGLQTLKQLNRAGWKKELKIADWPSFACRTVYDDISRGPISTMAYLKKQVERLAELKINYLSFYIEHVVQPLSHPDFAPPDGKLTIAQIKELSAYAAKYHMQLIGSFQSFGHFEKILALPQYRSMGATANMISPQDTAAQHFLSDVIGELCDAFSAPFFNINCDETFDLGKGKSKSYTDSVGVTKYYADHIKFLYDVVKKHNKRVMMWGDIALEHEEMLDMLPRDIIYLTWEYGSQTSFDKWITPFQQRGLEYMVVPGILNSYRMFPDMVMATANIDGFLKAGKEKGATGVITTVWDDGGAFLFSGDWYGVYKAADKSWNVNSSGKPSFDKRYTVTAYGDVSGQYVQALDTLMLLRKPALTFNLNENIWHQKILPDSGRLLIINNVETDMVTRILKNAKAAIDKAAPKWNAIDIRTLAFAIDQYIIMMDTRKELPLVAANYSKALVYSKKNDPMETAGIMKNVITPVTLLKERYIQLDKRFREAWLQENQLYSLEIAARPFAEKIENLTQLEKGIQSQMGTLTRLNNLAPPASLRLGIKESNNYYFQNWLLSGPYTMDNGEPPAFLYSGDATTEKTPKPGDLISYHEQPFRWQKYASPNGGITELADFYPNTTGGVAYAYCTVTTEKAIEISSYATSARGVEVFCNGTRVFGNAKPGDQPGTKEEEAILPLKAGVNHLLFKIPVSKNWSFSFRLAQGYTVTSQKHKYFLNTEKGNHEAE